MKNPAFIEHGQLMQFDLVLANPPYSISQWDREAFSTDKYGRNFLGTPPQGRADYAFFQHILKSLKPHTGRCAILFPHGVLFRKEEAALREKLIKSDMIECIIGLASNLFFNSPMEACIVICRTEKPPKRRGQILFINAVNDVTRKNAQSYLEPEHIRKIADAYAGYTDIENFAAVVTIADTEKNAFSLSIPLYVRDTSSAQQKPDIELTECIELWDESREAARAACEKVVALLADEEDA